MSITEVLPGMPETSTEQDLALAQQKVTGTVPVIPDAPDVVFELPRGLFHAGNWETTTEVRELTGVDEEALARFKDNYDFFDGVVVYGTARIGSVDLEGKPFGERQAMLAGLLVGEREQLFVSITRATFGDTKTLAYRCPLCLQDSEVDLELSRDMAFPEVDHLPLSFEHTTAKGKAIEYRLVTGADQMEINKRKGVSPADQNTFLLSKCILRVDGKELVDPLTTAREMSMRDRVDILDRMTEHQPSPNTSIEYECPMCDGVSKVEVAMGDIFRP